MFFNFTGDCSEVSEGICILKSRLGYGLSSEGAKVNVIRRAGSLEVSSDGNEYTIKYDKKIHFFRALALLCEHYGEKFKIREAPCFKSVGIMVDASRNAVMRPEKIKDLIEIMAVMGLNLLMMYTEDTFEVPEYPYFGYMRGRYSYDEMHSCDDCADIFGIEMIPCIQTLGHLTKALKWDYGLNIKDTEAVLMVGNEDTYEFIENIIKAAVKPFRSKRIHIGMDEAWDLGLGRYLMENGYKSTQLLIKEHFSRVNDIITRLGLEAMIWSDMYFRSGSKQNEYYDMNMEFSDEIIKSVPKELNLVYWDYYHENEKEFDCMIKNHQKLSKKIVFAGGIWTWGSMTINYRKTLKTAVPALKSCIKNGVETVFATLWGDNGNQVNVYESLYGMQLYAEMSYGHSSDREWLDKRFAACTGEVGNSFVQLGMPDDFGQTDDITANPSEYLLWQDILMGLLDKHINVKNISEMYRGCKEVMKSCAVSSKNYRNIFEYTYHLADVLEIKADIGVRIKECYDSGNMTALENICNCDIPELKERTEAFREVFRRLWLSVYKPFGFEVIDMRIGTLLGRIDTTRFRLKQYLNGEIDKIEELEQERLYYNLNMPLWEKVDHKKDLNVRTATYLKYVNAAYSSMGIDD